MLQAERSPVDLLKGHKTRGGAGVVGKHDPPVLHWSSQFCQQFTYHVKTNNTVQYQLLYESIPVTAGDYSYNINAAITTLVEQIIN